MNEYQEKIYFTLALSLCTILTASETDWTVLIMIHYCLFLNCISVSHVVPLSLSLLHSLQLIIQIRLKQIVPHTQREDGSTEVTVLGLWSAPGKVLYGGGQEAGGEEGRPDCSRKTK